MVGVPAWLNEQLLKSTLEKETKKQIEILKFYVENAAPPGSNYLSETLRIKVEYLVENYSLKPQLTGFIVKIPFSTGYSKELSDKLDFYTKEPAIYRELFPRLTDKLKEELFPKSYSCPIKDVLFLEDLKDKGYVMMNRIDLLDFEHSREVMVTIAKLHAASVACYHENPNLVKSFAKEFFYTTYSPIGKQTKPMLENAFRSIAEVTKELGCEAFSNLLFSRVDTIFESSTKLYKPKQTGLNVLVHGDLWTTNILFKHNELGKVVDVKLIDYQLTRYMSPVLDLLFLIWTSTTEEVRDRQDVLYSVYLQTLNLYLEKLGCSERLSPEELETEIKSSSDLALIQICNLLPFFVASSEDYIPLGDIDGENFQSSDSNQYQKLFRGKTLMALLPNLSRQFMKYFYP